MVIFMVRSESKRSPLYQVYDFARTRLFMTTPDNPLTIRHDTITGQHSCVAIVGRSSCGNFSIRFYCITAIVLFVYIRALCHNIVYTLP